MYSYSTVPCMNILPNKALHVGSRKYLVHIYLMTSHFLNCRQLQNINGTLYFPILYIDQVCLIASGAEVAEVSMTTERVRCLQACLKIYMY